MDKRKAEYQDWLKRRDDFLKQAEAGLTDIYKKMKPDAAALQLQDVKPELAAAVIMPEKTELNSTVIAMTPGATN